MEELTFDITVVEHDDGECTIYLTDHPHIRVTGKDEDDCRKQLKLIFHKSVKAAIEELEAKYKIEAGC